MNHYYYYTVSPSMEVTDHGLTLIDDAGYIRSGINKDCPVEDCCDAWFIYDEPQSKADILNTYIIPNQPTQTK